MIQCKDCHVWYCGHHGKGVPEGTVQIVGGHFCTAVVPPITPKVVVEESCLALAELAAIAYEAANLENPSELLKIRLDAIKAGLLQSYASVEN
jgi:hypothetical protein